MSLPKFGKTLRALSIFPNSFDLGLMPSPLRARLRESNSAILPNCVARRRRTTSTLSSSRRGLGKNG